MTNEEIRDAAIRAIGSIGDPPQCLLEIEKQMRELVLQVVEEAARIPESFRSSDYHSRETREALKRQREEYARQIRTFVAPS